MDQCGHPADEKGVPIMSRKLAVGVVAAAMLVTAPLSSAFADGGRHGDIGLGLLGAAVVGAVVGTALSAPAAPPPSVVVVQPQPVYAAPPQVIYAQPQPVYAAPPAYYAAPPAYYAAPPAYYAAPPAYYYRRY